MSCYAPTFNRILKLVATSLPLALLTAPVSAQTATLAQFASEAAQLEAEIFALEAENEIENLQRIFGFYTDKHLWRQAADLFAENGSIEIGGEGVYQGKDRVLAYLESKGLEGPQPGILDDQMQLQPVIHVNQDGTAQGRWHLFSQQAVHGENHFWGSGVYENDYVYEDGVWKIKSIQLYSTMRTPYEDGWGVTALPRSQPSATLPPDSPPTVSYENYPAVFVPPFHYSNPVTAAQPAPEADPAVSASLGSLDKLQAQISSLQHRASLLTDADAVEKLHTVYGYYLARNQWDDLTGIFAEDGTIEIALRGVYKGHASVRRNLDLYGVQNELPGTLHNHMQYQPVIHVAPDGQSALMRSRAFSMMGNYEGVARWMGGTYENIFVKKDGVWVLQKDQQLNTYFAIYDVGWKDMVWRAAPGVTDANPPDAPPSTNFEMYPRAYLPPFHYANPVTGRTGSGME